MPRTPAPTAHEVTRERIELARRLTTRLQDCLEGLEAATDGKPRDWSIAGSAAHALDLLVQAEQALAWAAPFAGYLEHDKRAARAAAHLAPATDYLDAHRRTSSAVEEAERIGAARHPGR